MKITLREYRSADVDQAIIVWNQVVEDGVAFPQEETLTRETGDAFFTSQTYTCVAVDETGAVVGLYILHPNNVGRCGHICNASYAVRRDRRGARIGEALVRDSLVRGKEKNFRILQFNAVVADNVYALRLYKQLGFVPLGVIPGGFRKPNGVYEDIVPHYRVL